VAGFAMNVKNRLAASILCKLISRTIARKPYRKFQVVVGQPGIIRCFKRQIEAMA
jgi:hypothetical protein